MRFPCKQEKHCASKNWILAALLAMTPQEFKCHKIYCVAAIKRLKKKKAADFHERDCNQRGLCEIFPMGVF